MKRTRSFSELLIPNDAWPKAGYQLFEQGHDRRKQAEFGGDPTSWFAAQSDGYKKAADLLVEEADGNRNFVVYPIVFCYRQFVELAIKGLLARYGNPIWNCHDLMRLWTELLRVLKQHAAETNQDTDPAAEEARSAATEYIRQISDFDPSSTISRYPVKTDGQPWNRSLVHIDLRRLEAGMDDLEAYFGYLIEGAP
jgi:HEPN domain-containing protein